MNRSLPRRVVLLIAFGLTVALPLETAVRVIGAGGATGGEGTFGVEPFLAALGLLTVINAAVGVAILWRRPGNLIGALLLIGSLMMTSVVAAWTRLIVIEPTPTGTLATFLTWWALQGLLPAVFVLFPTVGIVFPDGRLPGPRWRWPYGLAAATLVVGLVLQTIAPVASEGGEDPLVSPFAIPGLHVEVGELGAALAIISVLAAFVLALASVVVRFRRSTGVERAQVKWLAAAVALMSAIFPVSYLLEIGPEGFLDVTSVLVGCLLPIAIGIAVLRYRLYDIDRLISRTLSWAIVTGGVVTIFALLVVGLQGALEGLTQGETLAVALSTIIAAALFQPVRRRVQGAVDRRFDRGRYDAERTAAAFAERLRDDVDLDTLTDELRATVRTAVRPATATIWLLERGPAMAGSAVTIPGHSLPKVTPT